MKYDRNGRSTRHKLAYLAFAGVVLDVIFWSLYFTNIITLSEAGDIVTDGFESAFLVADCVLGISLSAAGIGLSRNQAFGDLFLIIASSMALYLGILDVTFYARQGFYSPLSFSKAFEILINLTCIGGGILGLLLGSMLSWKSYERI
jgi:hypothetical protein